MTDRLTVAVGDVHGRRDLLDELIECIRRIDAYAHMVFLGDYVDRGPDSADVIERLMKGDSSLKFTCLKGNHEEMLLDACSPEARRPFLDAWIRRCGGWETLDSYGAEWGELPADVIPDDHIDFIRSMPLSYDDGTRLFVHAGIKPGIPLDQQRSEEMLWIRDPFLECPDDHGRLIVHGHTPNPQGPEVRHNRIGIDTMAFSSGILTAAAFEHGTPTPRFIQTDRELMTEPPKP